MKSARMGGEDALYVDPVSIPVNYDYVWVKRVSMCKACDYTIHGAQHHFGWDNSLAPAERVAPGSTILFHCHDSVRRASLARRRPWQTWSTSTSARSTRSRGRSSSTGAKPGDALKVTLDSFAPKVLDGKGFGWTANIPGFGLLADQFTDPALCTSGPMTPTRWSRRSGASRRACR